MQTLLVEVRKKALATLFRQPLGYAGDLAIEIGELVFELDIPRSVGGEAGVEVVFTEDRSR